MIKRPLFVIAVSFVLGEGLALQNAVVSWILALALLGLAAGSFQVVQWEKQRIWPLLFLAALLLGGFRGGQVRGRMDQEAAWAQEFQDMQAEAWGTVVQARESSSGIFLILQDVQIRAGDQRIEARRLGVYGQTQAIPPIGQRLHLAGDLQALESPRNPGQFDGFLYGRSQGYSCQMYAQDMEPEGDDFWPYDQWIQLLRRRWKEVLEQICPPEDAGLFKAVILGDTAGMDPEIKDMYQRHGISHLLAVSGQHLSIVGGGIYLILRRLGLGLAGSGLAAGVLVISYGMLTGSSGSALRAVTMILCLWLGKAIGRTYDSLSALGLAALWLLWEYPYLMFQSGFQLSFGAVWAISGLGPWLSGALGAERPWQKTLAMSLAVQMVTAPVVAWHFFRYPVYGLCLNLLLVPLAAGLVYSGFLGIFLGSLWEKAGIWAIGAGHYILAFYEASCRLFEHLPGYSLLTGRPGWMQMALYLAGLGAGLWILRRRKKDGFWKKTGAALGLLAAGVCLLRARSPNHLRITFLDVGQGDGIVLECPGGRVLMDGGSTSNASLGERCLVPFLESRGIERIDYAFVSHGDQDHISGLLYLLQEEPDLLVDCLVLPQAAENSRDESYQALVQAAAQRGTKISYLHQGDVIGVGELTLTCLYGGSEQAGDEVNRHSPVIRADYGAFGALFTGDLDAWGEEQLLEAVQPGDLKQIQVLKTAHHGSDTSSSLEFLEALSPDWAVISYGRGNFYGHPSETVTKRMDRLGIQRLETGRSGAVLMETNGCTLQIREYIH